MLFREVRVVQSEEVSVGSPDVVGNTVSLPRCDTGDQTIGSGCGNRLQLAGFPTRSRRFSVQIKNCPHKINRDDLSALPTFSNICSFAWNITTFMFLWGWTVISDALILHRVTSSAVGPNPAFRRISRFTSCRVFNSLNYQHVWARKERSVLFLLIHSLQMRKGF